MEFRGRKGENTRPVLRLSRARGRAINSQAAAFAGNVRRARGVPTPTVRLAFVIAIRAKRFINSRGEGEAGGLRCFVVGLREFSVLEEW